MFLPQFKVKTCQNQGPEPFRMWMNNNSWINGANTFPSVLLLAFNSCQCLWQKVPNCLVAESTRWKLHFKKWHQIYSQTTTCLGKNLPENGWEYFPSRGLLVDQWAVLQRLLSYLYPIEPYQSTFHSPFSVSFGYFRLFDGYLEIYALRNITKKAIYSCEIEGEVKLLYFKY